MAMFAVATATIDVGLARVAQNEMQTAADGAALAGLSSSDDPAAHASAVSAATFAFSDPSGPATSHPLGIVHHPDDGNVLYPNLTNAIQGDVVSGSFLASNPATYSTPIDTVERSATSPTPYQRVDFNPTAGLTNGTLSPALLVRIRRMNSNTLGLAGGGTRSESDDSNDGTSSSGPAAPYLFGHGAFLNPDPTDATGYSPYRDGLFLRATAIAAQSPATSVGAPASGLVGVTPFAIADTNFTAAQSFTLPANGVVTLATPLTLTGAFAATSGEGYVPIYTLSVNGSPLVVGFVAANYTIAGGAVTLGSLGSVTPLNASAATSLPALGRLSVTQQSQLLTARANAALASPLPLLQAPVLAR